MESCEDRDEESEHGWPRGRGWVPGVLRTDEPPPAAAWTHGAAGAGQLVRRKPVNIPRVPDAAEGRLPVTKARSPST